MFVLSSYVERLVRQDNKLMLQIALRNIILGTIDRMANQHLQKIYVPDSSACGRSFDRLSQVVLENIKVLNVK
jgi:hypothetical protein